MHLEMLKLNRLKMLTARYGLKCPLPMPGYRLLTDKSERLPKTKHFLTTIIIMIVCLNLWKIQLSLHWRVLDTQVLHLQEKMSIVHMEWFIMIWAHLKRSWMEVKMNIIAMQSLKEIYSNFLKMLQKLLMLRRKRNYLELIWARWKLLYPRIRR